MAKIKIQTTHKNSSYNRAYEARLLKKPRASLACSFAAGEGKLYQQHSQRQTPHDTQTLYAIAKSQKSYGLLNILAIPDTKSRLNMVKLLD